ncbi:TrkH family potassium uptake protein [Spiroplasma taiwanense]|uniref:Potassium uptake protein KtrB n=1 Tax=Spiroplasma taiwanense CT-1 TaxID=1276220 RepID=S5MAQ1_9MOLU|nr:potassium transporter TrkG [Spiroplasma taiwanense]AGR40838.1 potassium uptake protein KtrB [Spiroplasma taiwanense CT-1]
MDNSSKKPNKLIKEKQTKKKERKSLDKENNFFSKLKNWWPFSRISGRIISIYLISILIGGFLLSIPGVVLTEQNYWQFITGMFTASSAISDTGITILQTNTNYSFIGELLIIIMCQIGGIGILTVKIVLMVMLGRKISLDDQSVAQTERGNSALSNTVEMIRDAFIFLLWLEIIGVFFLFFGFYFTPMDLGTVYNEKFQPLENLINENSVTNPYHDFSKSLWAAIFHSISATNNAGFDIVSGNSLLPYNQGNSHAYLLQVTFLFQWVIGGLGYPTYHDIKRKIKAKREGKTVRFSLFTKLNFIMYSILFILGPLLVFMTEHFTVEESKILLDGKYIKDTEGNINWVTTGEWKKTHIWIMDLLFNVSSTRNAGFATVDVNEFTAGSKFVMSVWMFIGAAPSSTAGGIRTTTFAICILAIYSIMRNKKSVEAFKKKIPDDTVKRAFAVVFLSFFIVVTSIFVVYLDSNKMLYATDTTKHTESTIIKLIMYVCSAFGTVGFQPFSNEQIIQLGVISKLMLVITMFVGQLGISNTLLAFVKPRNKQNFGYLEEEVVIG